MAFISNKERKKVSSRLYRGAAFKKFFILITLFFMLLITLLIVVGLFGDLDRTTDDAKKYSGWIIMENDQGKYILTSYGLACAIVASVGLAMTFISIILLFTMRSPRSITKDVYKLTSSALPGKKSTGHTSRDAKSRL